MLSWQYLLVSWQQICITGLNSKGECNMTEKDLEVQELRQKIDRMNCYIDYAKKRIKQLESDLDVAKSDLYKAVVYDCKCSLCARCDECCDENMTETCFLWKREI